MAGAATEMTLSGLAAYAEARASSLPALSFQEPLRICKVMVVADTKKNFDESHDPGGAPWLRLKRPRKNSKGNDQPLRNFGLLMAASTSGVQETLTDTELILMNNLDYAGPHQWGVDINIPEQKRPYPGKPFAFPGPDGELIFSRRIKAHTVHIPQRQFMGFGPQITEDIQQVFLDFIGGKL